MEKEQLIQSVIENMAKCQRPAIKYGWKEIGLSHAQMGMLYLLHYHPEASVKEAADFLGISKSAATQLLDPLADKGLIERQNDPSDRRIVRLSLTGKGGQALKKMAKHKYAGLRSAMEALSQEELRQLNHLYKKMAGSL